ncbi:c-type cytochrome [Alkalibacillus haloalkaliphilus]|uniref:c-type cytochrome n=1 Tax=Alkalibacillus haloalkaliphilus TaxID=94136 RepID=UPI00030FA75E|nr:cytochrome c [Alkalibacillus haloalkaliphilus]
MSRNPIIPYVTIATLGIIAMIVMAGVGLDQMRHAEEATEETEEAADNPEAIYENNCLSCHGGDLEGGSGPELQNAGDRFSLEELEDIISNGVEGSSIMTGDYATNEEAEILAEWLMEQ